MNFNHMKYNEAVWKGTVFDVSPGIQEGLLDLRLLHKLPGNRNITTSVDLPKATTSSAFKNFMGKDEFVHALQVLAPRFQLFGTFIPDNCKRTRFTHMHS